MIWNISIMVIFAEVSSMYYSFPGAIYCQLDHKKAPKMSNI
ncbi:MAG: hypothetical protein ACFFA4_04035 [Promethearchaeota archaeon]